MNSLVYKSIKFLFILLISHNLFGQKDKITIFLKNGTQRSASIKLQYVDGLGVIANTSGQLIYHVENQKKGQRLSLDSIEKVTLTNDVVFIPVNVINPATNVSKQLLARLAYEGKVSLLEFYQYSSGGGHSMPGIGTVSGFQTSSTSSSTSSRYYLLNEGDKNAIRFNKNKSFKEYMKKCKSFAKRFKGWKAREVPAVNIIRYYMEHCEN